MFTSEDRDIYTVARIATNNKEWKKSLISAAAQWNKIQKVLFTSVRIYFSKSN